MGRFESSVIPYDSKTELAKITASAAFESSAISYDSPTSSTVDLLLIPEELKIELYISVMLGKSYSFPYSPE